MAISNKFLSAFTITLLVSACGSSSINEDAATTDKTMTQETAKTNTEQAATELATTPINAKKLVKHKAKEQKDEFSNWQRGRVQFLNLEGGFYGIITDSGKKILPMNMTKEFAQNGAIVRIKGKVKDIMTIQQWGTPFTITEIELITPGSKVNGADR